MNTRRQFIGQCCAAVGTTGILSTLAQLRATAAVTSLPARAAATPADYKALVCIYLNGGNDANNLIIPTGSGYAAYSSQRNILALPSANLLALSPRTSDGRTWALHPAVSKLHTLFQAGKMAVMANVGTLVRPTSKADYTAGRNLPPQLFSHNDQTVQWQSSVSDQPFTTGWGGRMADLVDALNSNPQVSMAISLDGFNNFEVGRNVLQYAINPTSGAIVFTGSTARSGNDFARYTAQRELFAGSNPNLFAAAFGTLTRDAMASSELLNTTLAGATALQTVFPATTLGNQLKMIARLISVASSLNVKRQIFFARRGGWDLHADQVDDVDRTIGAHARLLGEVSDALSAFYDATLELGVADQVVAFTASDFGRTYSSNGDGSDHGWGSHSLVVGGAVKGGDIYGRMPDLTINGSDDTGRGRWIPTTSVDEFGATFASWFGVSPTNLPVAFPNLGRFARPNVGFL